MNDLLLNLRTRPIKNRLEKKWVKRLLQWIGPQPWLRCVSVSDQGSEVHIVIVVKDLSELEARKTIAQLKPMPKCPFAVSVMGDTEPECYWN